MTSGTPSRQGVFVDTSAYVALAVLSDQNRARATSIARGVARQRADLYTTNFVVAETHAFVLARAGRVAARRMLERIDRGSGLIVRVEPDDELNARSILDRYDDKDFSLVDAMSFAVMDRLGIRRAFAFDRHFSQYGFQLVDVP
jgi:predicted nucleic acid-binding protein